MESLFSIVIALIIAAVIFGLVVWLIGWIGVPEPFAMIIRALVGIAVVLYLVGILTGYAPHFPLRR